MNVLGPIMRRTAFDTANPDLVFGYWEHDPASDRLKWNPKMREVFGLDERAPNPTFREFLEFVHPEDRDLVVQALTEDVFEFAFRVRRPDGENRVLHSLSFGRLLSKKGERQVAGVVYDMTDENHIEDRHAAIERYRTLIDNLPALVCRYLPDGTLVHVNAAYAALFGLEPDRMVGMNWLDHLTEGDRGFVKRRIADFDRRAPSGTYVHWIDTPKDGRRWISWTDHGVFDDDGKLTEIQSIGLDLTEHRKIERHIFHLSKLRSLGTLAATTAHELHQPLAAISLAAENLLAAVAQEGENDAIARKLKGIISQAERLKGIVKKIKSLGKPVSETERIIDLNATVGECIDFLRYVFDHQGVALSVRHADSGPRIFGSPDLVGQVVINVLTNAREAVLTSKNTHAGMKPSVSLAIEEDRTNRQAIIRISDNGGGVEKSLIPKLFEPFFTTKSDDGGTGLGLAISASIIDRMRGRIRAFNDKEGLTVEIRIPLVDDGARLPAVADDPPPE